MMYQVSVNKTYNKQFLEIMESLKELRIVESIQLKKSLTLPSDTFTDDELIEIIFESKKQIKNGNSYTMEEVKQRIESWKNK